MSEPQKRGRPRTNVPAGGSMSQSVVSLKEAAQFLSVSEQTVRRLISSGDLPGYTIGKVTKSRRLIRIRVADLEALLHRIPTLGDLR